MSERTQPVSLSAVASEFEISRETARNRLRRSGAQPTADGLWRIRDVILAMLAARGDAPANLLASVATERAREALQPQISDIAESLKRLRVPAKDRAERDRLAAELVQLLEDENSNASEDRPKVDEIDEPSEPVAAPTVPAAPRQATVARIDAMASMIAETLDRLAAAQRRGVPPSDWSKLMALAESVIESAQPVIERASQQAARAAVAAQARRLPEDQLARERREVLAQFADLRQHNPHISKTYATTKIAAKLKLPRDRVKRCLTGTK